MILTYGDTTNFGDLEWYMVELRSEKTIESTLRRLGQSLPSIFGDSAVEIFVPLSKRDLNVFELNTVNCLFARSPNFAKLLRLKAVTGVVGLATYGDTYHVSRVIPVQNAFVQENVVRAENKFLNRAETIDVGYFVRILDGDMRDWCGSVAGLHDGVSVVMIEIKTKLILVETPVRNLLNKNDVPEHLRVFYYTSLVEELDAAGLAYLVAEDLHYESDQMYVDDGLEAPQPTRHSRQQTVTALVKRLIVTGTRDPREIAKVVLQALQDNALKTPRNLSIVHGVIKSRLIEDHFKKIDPSVQNYRDVVANFGQQYRFSLQDLAELDPGIGIPLVTEVLEEKLRDKPQISLSNRVLTGQRDPVAA